MEPTSLRPNTGFFSRREWTILGLLFASVIVVGCVLLFALTNEDLSPFVTRTPTAVALAPSPTPTGISVPAGPLPTPTGISVAATPTFPAQSLPSPTAPLKAVLAPKRDGDITLLPNGDLRFVETWQLKFVGGPFTFASQAIPLTHAVDIVDWGVSEGNTNYVLSANGTAQTFSLTNEPGARSVRWVYPATTDQTRTFTLRYTVRGGLRVANDGDSIEWQFIDAAHPYVIESSRVVVHLPTTLDASKLKITALRNGVAEPAGRVIDSKTIEFIGAQFQPDATWDLLVQFPRGTVPATPAPWQLNEQPKK